MVRCLFHLFLHKVSNRRCKNEAEGRGKYWQKNTFRSDRNSVGLIVFNNYLLLVKIIISSLFVIYHNVLFCSFRE